MMKSLSMELKEIIVDKGNGADGDGSEHKEKKGGTQHHHRFKLLLKS